MDYFFCGFICIICIITSPVDSIDPVIMYVKPGETATFICPERSPSIPTIWTRQNYELPIVDGQILSNYCSNGKCLVTGDHSRGEYNLIIKNVTHEDEGKFTCVPVKNGILVHFEFQLKLKVPPSNMEIKDSYNNKICGYEGMSLILECSVSKGQPPETLSWSYNDRVVMSGGPERLIYVLNLTRSHHLKTFTCTANNSATANPLTEHVTLHVEFSPTVNIKGNTKVIEGSPTSLECEEISNPPVTHVIWWKVSKNGMNHRLHNAFELRFDHVTRRDVGDYICECINKRGSGTAQITLDVLFPPDITLSNKSYPADDTTRKMRCMPSGNPQNYTFFEWEHKSEFGEHIRFLTGSADGILTLQDTSSKENHFQDSGFYTCQVSNGVPGANSKVTQSKTAFLQILGKPVILSYQKKIYGMVDGPAKLYLDIISKPKFLTVHSLKTACKNTNVAFNYTAAILETNYYNVSVRVTGYKVWFKIISISEFCLKTNITIEVSNEYGRTDATIEINQATAPHKPLSFNVTSKDNQFLVSWQRNFDGGLKQTFVIEYKLRGDDQWSTIVSPNQSKSEELTWTITGVKHNKHYMVRMYAQNILGKSNRTDEIHVTTTGDPKLSIIYVTIAGSIVAVVLIFGVVLSCLRCRLQRISPDRVTTTSVTNTDDVVYYEIPDDLVSSDTRAPNLPAIPERPPFRLLKASDSPREEDEISTGYLTPHNPDPQNDIREMSATDNSDVAATEILRNFLRDSNSRNEVTKATCGNSTVKTVWFTKMTTKSPYCSLKADRKNKAKQHEYMPLSKNM